MTIKQVNTGAHGRKPRYFIENEGGGTVAYFDNLCTAALNRRRSIEAQAAFQKRKEAE